MKQLATFLFLFIPTLVFAQDREKSYEVEGYKFNKPKVETRSSPDLKEFECDPVEEFEKKSPYRIGKEYIPAEEESESLPSNESQEEQDPSGEEVGNKFLYELGKECASPKEDHKISISVLIGVELFEYVAVENHGKDCLEKWTDTVVGYFKEYFEQNNIELSVEELTSSFCLQSSSRSIHE